MERTAEYNGDLHFYSLDPDDITLFGTIGIVLASYGLTNPIEKLLRTLLYDFSLILTLGDVFKYTPKERKRAQGLPYNITPRLG